MVDYPHVLVILGTRSDPHVDRVALLLERYSTIKVVIVDYLDDTRFSFEMNEKGENLLIINGHKLPKEYLVWDRRKILPGTDLYIKGNYESRGFIADEWRAFYTLICGLNPGNVVNSLESRSCMVKPIQQIVAASSGLLVPPTLVCNDKPEAIRFQSAHEGKLILKSLSGAKVSNPGDGEVIPFNIMTMRIGIDDLAQASSAEIAYCPHFFQAEIEKSHELRVVYVNGHILPFQVDSQSHRLSELDWRKALDCVPFRPCEIDARLSTKISSFMTSMKFFSGSLDFIIDKRGQPWFLECNQDGAWGWLDDICNGDISKAFASAFSKQLGLALNLAPPSKEPETI